jgi:putative helicase MOV10L1/helicase MOV-10
MPHAGNAANSIDAEGGQDDRRVDELSNSGNSSNFRQGGTATPLNVLVGPFVSERARKINREAGALTRDTPLPNEVDYAAYCNQELITGLLPRLPSSQPAYSHQAASHANLTLRPGTYEHFFRFHLDEEICAQQPENDSYSLYEHDPVVEFVSGLPAGAKDEATVTIVVPGMREGTPMIEHDDVVRLRQLRVDDAGRLLLHYPDPLEAAPWVSVVYNARVLYASPNKETAGPACDRAEHCTL